MFSLLQQLQFSSRQTWLQQQRENYTRNRWGFNLHELHFSLSLSLLCICMRIYLSLYTYSLYLNIHLHRAGKNLLRQSVNTVFFYRITEAGLVLNEFNANFVMQPFFRLFNYFLFSGFSISFAQFYQVRKIQFTECNFKNLCSPEIFFSWIFCRNSFENILEFFLK